MRRLRFARESYTTIDNRYVVGSGVGGVSRAVRRALLRRASNGANGKPCGFNCPQPPQTSAPSARLWRVLPDVLRVEQNQDETWQVYFQPPACSEYEVLPEGGKDLRPEVVFEAKVSIGSGAYATGSITKADVETNAPRYDAVYSWNLEDVYTYEPKAGETLKIKMRVSSDTITTWTECVNKEWGKELEWTVPDYQE